MNKYEMLYIIQNDVDDEVKNKIVEKYSKLVESLNGTVESVDKWGTKKYAYKINFKSEGYYVLMNFTAADTVPQELSRQLGNDENVVREMIIRK
ncbi:MAG: 30S ribosomal protein S6 [Acidaminococcus sp.]|nr:30S ribosomal protein S6 [Acidaminococcus sp.]MDD7398391.1 30S ribosomal protein S6 [Bacillota bacterium]MDY4559810.1 30S ribosomal protein S6 [Eubacteriales bacterium]MDY5345021.1 30S ribosomal protein S6 [Eubacteriales bacterium]